MTVASLFAELGVDTSPMTGVARDAQRKLQPLQKTFQRLGSSLTKFVTVPLAGAAAAAAKSSADIQDSLSQAQAQAGLTGEQIGRISDASESIAVETGESMEDVVEAFKFAQSAGLDFAESQELVEQSAKGAAAGFGSQTQLLRGATTVMAAFGDEVGGAEKILDKTVATAQNLEVEVDSMTGVLGQISQVASEVDISFDEMLAAMGSVGEQMGDVTKAGNLMSTALTKLLDPSKDTRDKLQEIGTSADQLQSAIEERGLTQALSTLRQRTEEAGTEFASLLGSARQARVFLALTADEGERVAEVQDAAADSAGRLQQAFEQSASFTRLLSRAMQALRVAARPLGETLIERLSPALRAVINAAGRAADFFSSLSDATQNVIIGVGAAAAALGPLLLALSGILAVAPAVAGALAGLASIAPQLAAVGAVGAAIVANWESVKRFFVSGGGAEIWDAIKTAAAATKDTVMDVFNSLKQALFTLVSAFQDAVEGGGGLLGLIGRRLAEGFELLGNIAVPVLDQIANVIGFTANTVGRAISFMVNLLTGDFAGAWQDVKDQAGAFERFLKRTLGNMVDALITFVESAVNVLPGVNVELDSMRQAARDWREGVEDSMQGARRAVEEVEMGRDEQVWSFEAEMREMEQVSIAAEDMSGRVEEAFQYVAGLARDMGSAVDEGVGKVTSAFTKARKEAQGFRQATDEAFATTGEKRGKLNNQLDIALTRQGELLQGRKDTNEAIQQAIDYWTRLNRIRAQGGPSTAQEEAAQDPDEAETETDVQVDQPGRIQAPSLPTEELGVMGRLIEQVKTSFKEMSGIIKNRVARGLSTMITQGRAFGQEINNLGDAFEAFGNLAQSILQRVIQKIIMAKLQGESLKKILGSGGGTAGAIGLAALGVGLAIKGITTDPEGRASGGPVQSGRSYIVGEEEPEIFTPSRSGTVTPKSMLDGARTRKRIELRVQQPEALPNGDLQYSVKEGGRQDKRRGFPDDT